MGAGKSQQMSMTLEDEICLLFIFGECIFKGGLLHRSYDKCIHVHYHLPYKWQVLDKDGKTWNDLKNEAEIEEAFCNPANDVSPGSLSVNFTSMMCEGAPVQRLSTVSSVTQPAHFMLTTEWHWYWKNEDGGWTEYGQGFDEEHAVSVTSEKLETAYQTDPQSEIPVSSAKHNYYINFKGMYQQNNLYETKKEIRRRPWFVSAQDVESKLKSKCFSSVEVPERWDKQAVPQKLVPLLRAEEEFLMIEKMFKKTMPKFAITSIQRNQNSFLWKMFQCHKEQMKERNEGKDVDERLLFHGTDSSLVDAICQENFDFRVCGKNAVAYGKGSYFARDASLSNVYAESLDDSKKMFVARVLVGHYTHGQRNFVRPPPKSGAQSFYDSCVNDENNPSIFVIFEKYQIYPEFIIEYVAEDSKCIDLKSFNLESNNLE